MKPIRLWYRQPASQGRASVARPAEDFPQPSPIWQAQALPIGNGAMGALLFGEVERERILFNEKTLWSGGPHSKEGYVFGNRPGAAKSLQEVRALLSEGKRQEALELAERTLTGDPRGFGSYQPFGEIVLEFLGHNSPTDYERSLDLEEAVATVSYRQDGVLFTREAFCSYPDRLIAIRLSAEAPGALNLRVGLESARPAEAIVNALLRKGDPQDYGILRMSGLLDDNDLLYAARLHLTHTGGELHRKGQMLELIGANEATLLLACATEYRIQYPHYRRGRPHNLVTGKICAAARLSWDELIQRHKENHASLFNRVKLTLGRHEEPELPTDELLEQYAAGQQNGLEELMFYYSRYLLIASSRPGSLPANLQGVWNPETKPAWRCDYHFNINLQMNYWLTGPANLLECGNPLFQYIRHLVAPGEVTAREHFGMERGWVVNAMNNPFGYTAPGWEFRWGWSPNSNAFICQNLWELWRFSGDPSVLGQIYPILKGAAEFWLNYIINDSDGKLVSTPSFSPEHGDCVVGCAMDQQLADELFRHVITATELLDRDLTLQRDLKEARSRLSSGLRIGRWGQLQEWKEDLDDPDDHHRHVSHLVGLFPGDSIARADPAYRAAARVSLEHRGDVSTGWSRAWKLCLWSRLRDGAHAYRLLRGQLESCTYPNLFDVHPPFQIDGNLGYGAGVCEMLMQSWDDCVELLPAIPPEWFCGSFSGLLARGGFEVSAQWEDSRVRDVEFRSRMGGTLRLRTGSPCQMECGGNVTTLDPDDSGIVEFPTNAGGVYRLTLRGEH